MAKKTETKKCEWANAEGARTPWCEYKAKHKVWNVWNRCYVHVCGRHRRVAQKSVGTFTYD